MVLDVCRCVLRSHADAEDAFQAVFLTLATRAASVRAGASLAGWLHGVAYRTALKARVAAARRRAREARAEGRGAEAPPDLSWAEVQEAVHESLLALPDEYRMPLVLCYLEGRTQDEAARSLGLSRAGLKKRLERGRALLRERLVRRGLGPGAALLAAAWPAATSRALPVALARSTALAGTLLAAGDGTVTPAVSAHALALVERGSRAAWPTALKLAAAAALVLGSVCFAAYQAAAKPESPPEPPRPAASPPAEPSAEKPGPADRYGDPLPPHAVARLGTVRFRSDGWISQAAVVPGGKQVLGLGSGSVILWDAATGKEVRRFAGPAWRMEGGTGYSVQVGSFAVSPDGKALAVGTWDGSRLDCPILLFDLATGRKLGEWPAHRSNGSSANRALAFVTPELLVSAGADGSVRVWDLATKREARRLTTPDKGPVWQLVPSPDGKYVFAGGSDGKAGYWIAWEVATGKVTRREADLPARSVKLALSPDGATLAVALGTERTPKEGGHTEVRVYSGPDWKERRRWRAHEGEFWSRCSVAFAPDGRTVATGGADQKVRRWDVATGKEIGPVIQPYAQYANNVSYLDRDTLMTFDAQHTLKFWDPATGKPKLEFAGSESHLTALAYSPDGRHVATGGGGGDSTIRVWEVSTGKQVAQLKGELFDVTSLQFSPDGGRIVSGESGGTARLWDWAKGGAPVRNFPDHKPWLHSVAFSPDGKQIATGDDDGVVRVFDQSSGKLVRRFEGHTAAVCALAYAPDGQTLFSGGWDHSIRQWDLTTGKVVRVIVGVQDLVNRPKPVGHTNVVTSLAVSPGGRWLYSGSYDHTICVWETASGQLCRVLKGEERTYSSVKAIALSPDGTWLAAAIGDEGQQSSVHLWDVLSGKKVGAFPGHRGAVTKLAFSPDGRRLASASTDTTVLIWDVAGQARPAEELGARAARLWDDLASGDPAVAYEAVCRWAAAGGGAVAGLKARLKPVAAVDAAKVAGLVRRLDSDDFAEREQASQALSDLGPGAEEAMRDALKKAESAEVKDRLERLLKECAKHRRRSGHAIEALEMVGTAEAKRLLTDLAGGASGASVTREAAEAVARLRKRP
jgi:RNA polymerase sigma factor (sigma-70 family)